MTTLMADSSVYRVFTARSPFTQVTGQPHHAHCASFEKNTK